MENDEVVQALRNELARLTRELTPDVSPADIYSPSKAKPDEGAGE